MQHRNQLEKSNRDLFQGFTICLLVASWVGGVAGLAGLLRAEEPSPSSARYAIAVHGGAGSAPDRLSPEARTAYRASLSSALRRGRDLLEAGKSSLDVVETVVRYLEDDPQFNAGKGAVLNSRGSCELDASIMDGRNLAGGAVAGVTRVKNPVSLARLVMERTRHVLLAGDGADQFAIQMEVARVEPSYFLTPRAQQRFQRIQQQRRQQPPPGDSKRPTATRHAKDVSLRGQRDLGTVGCVALDRHGNLAAATSTGGLSNKKYGRIGDSPILGAGTYASNATCAVSCTGTGEQFIRHAIAYSVSARVRLLREDLATAVRRAIHDTLDRGDGGIIAVDHRGNIAIDFSTQGMARGWADANGAWEVRVGREDGRP